MKEVRIIISIKKNIVFFILFFAIIMCLITFNIIEHQQSKNIEIILKPNNDCYELYTVKVYPTGIMTTEYRRKFPNLINNLTPLSIQTSLDPIFIRKEQELKNNDILAIKEFKTMIKSLSHQSECISLDGGYEVVLKYGNKYIGKYPLIEYNSLELNHFLTKLRKILYISGRNINCLSYDIDLIIQTQGDGSIVLTK